ncbi:MAG TPA: NDP-sugar synthase [Pyrinomonadaceae bacterium]|nr:NDP-sugar synthase [Pyrinomonadaceae bacterium]
MKAMILAAGYGERLWPLTADRTKPALPVLGKPLVGYVAEYLAGYGVSEAIVNLHHRPESVRGSLGDGGRFGLRLEYIHEPLILGTSGALDNAKDFFDDGPFVLINGKIITDIDLNSAMETHRRTGALATLVLKRNAARERFSVVETRDGMVTGFAGMPLPGEEGVPLMFTGIQILEPRIFDYIPRGVFSHTTTDVYPQAIAAGERIAAHVGEGIWHELSTLRRYLDISLALLKAEGRNVYLGTESFIEAGAMVQDSILWTNVLIESGATVTSAIIGDGVRVTANERWEGAVVVRAEVVEGKTPPAKALKGQIIGDKFVVPLSQ